jgi:AraC family transcriptional regulator of arabinose operon
MRLLTPDVEPLWIARYDYEPSWRLPAHAHHDYFQIILFVSGEGEALIGRTHRTFHAGQMLFLRPGVIHGLAAGPNAAVRTLDTKFIVHRSKLRVACGRLDSFHPHVDEKIATLLETIYAEARCHRRYTNELCQTLFAQLLLQLLQNEPASSTVNPPSSVPLAAGDDDLVQRIERYLRENCARMVDQQTLSAALHYSYRHLHNVWLKHHRESPLRALWLYRIARATELMRYSDYELKRIAELSGFSTVHHFTRVFTSTVKTSPARWRENERTGIRQDIVMRSGFINQALTVQSQS